MSRASTIELFNISCLKYSEGLALQHRLCAEIREGRRAETLLLLEHAPVITMGRGAQPGHLLVSRQTLAEKGVELCESERGGDVTYHGPGQLVGYPLLDLMGRGRDIHAYLRDLECLIVEAIAPFGLTGEAAPGLTGVWVNGRKISAIGVHARGWVTSHGFSLNVEEQSEGFSLIVPCGLHGREVTSVERETGRRRPMREARQNAAAAFAHVFQCETVEMPASALVPSGAA